MLTIFIMATRTTSGLCKVSKRIGYRGSKLTKHTFVLVCCINRMRATFRESVQNDGFQCNTLHICCSGHMIVLCMFKEPPFSLSVIVCTQGSPHTNYKDQSRAVQIMCCLATMNLYYQPEYQRPCLHPATARVCKAGTGLVQITICFSYLNSWLLLSCRWLLTCHLLFAQLQRYNSLKRSLS